MFNHKQLAKSFKDASDLSDKRQKAAEAALRAQEAEKAAKLASEGAWDGLYDVLRSIVASDPVARDSALGRALK